MKITSINFCHTFNKDIEVHLFIYQSQWNKQHRLNTIAQGRQEGHLKQVWLPIFITYWCDDSGAMSPLFRLPRGNHAPVPGELTKVQRRSGLGVIMRSPPVFHHFKPTTTKLWCKVSRVSSSILWESLTRESQLHKQPCQIRL